MEHLNHPCESSHRLYAVQSCKLSPHPGGIFLYSFSFFLFQGRLEIVNGELTIHKVQQADSGMYQCVAENKYAAIYSNAELQILGIS